MREEQLQGLVAQLWTRYREPMLQRVAVLQRALEELRLGPLGADLRAQALREAHKLAGTLGTFGFPEGSAVSRELEAELTAPAPDPLQVQARLERLRRIMAEGAKAAEPAPVPQLAAGEPVVLIVDADAGLSRQLAGEIWSAGMKTAWVADVASARALCGQLRPLAVLLELPQVGRAQALDFMSSLAAQSPPVPVIALTENDDFVTRVAVARRGGRGYFEKPLVAAKVAETLLHVALGENRLDAKVMLIDDDRFMVDVLRQQLEAHGLRVVAHTDPLSFWEALPDEAPDLIMMDVDMPALTGIDLCRVLRSDPRYLTTPVLFLTAKTDAATVQNVFAAGADDYVAKPVVGPELITRIANRLERSQLSRHLAETDILTGVANRRKSTMMMDHYLRLAGRRHEPMSWVVIDVDRFKQINDRHGHAVGDAVLRRLGEQLKRCFRGEDIIGRWGGEEFVVGLYGMDRDAAARRVSDLLGQFAEIPFTGAEGGSFGVTFSAGIAEFPTDGEDLLTLYRAADAALYQAKAAGRCCVVAASPKG